MSFNNVNFGKEQTNKLLEESVGPGLYQLDTPLNKQEGYPHQPTLRIQKSGASVSKNRPLDDVDSELMGLNVKNSNCKDCVTSSHDGILCKNGNKEDLHHFKDCYMPSEYTRLSNPPCT